MAFALSAKQIDCPNCGFEGRAKVLGSASGVLVWLVVSAIGLVFWPLLIIGGIGLLWAAMKPAKQICPNCEHPHPIPKPMPRWRRNVNIGGRVVLWLIVAAIFYPMVHQAITGEPL